MFIMKHITYLSTNTANTKIITYSSVCIAVVMCFMMLMYQQFNHLKWSVLVACWLVSAHSYFNVLSGGTIECLVEPWHARVSTAGSLYTITLLPIPQGIICV